MLIVREQQMRALDPEALREFEERTVPRLRNKFPPLCTALGDATLRGVIEFGVERGARHGLSANQDLWGYLDLMLMLGSHFDVDPQLPWAQRGLDNPDERDPRERLLTVQTSAVQYLDIVGGPQGKRMVAALRRIADRDWTRWSTAPGRAVDEAIAQTLAEVYPEKWDNLQGWGRTRALVESGCIAAAHHQLPLDWGTMVFVLLQLMLGSGFDRDPQFPWAARALSPARDLAGAHPATALHTEARAFAVRLNAALPSTIET